MTYSARVEQKQTDFSKISFHSIHMWRNLQFKIESKQQIYGETFHNNFIFTLRVFARNLLSGSYRRNIFLYFGFDV